ncbi:hypothetical protein AYO40_04895 [Planctomycetaceae bacterium SCGC AG-212-D15]|nr:hypothetical protein AYO40_04895 [Planctomycetaceae bacterium SCGC AG-212-D15]
MSRKPCVPSYRLHKASGQAVVVLNGKSVYLGRFDSAESKQKYERTVEEWLANHRLLPGPAPTPPVSATAPASAPESAPVATAAALTIEGLVLAYWRFVKGYYVKDGQPTSEQDTVRQAMRFLRKLYGATPAGQFGPLARLFCDRPAVGQGITRSPVMNPFDPLRWVRDRVNENAWLSGANPLEMLRLVEKQTTDRKLRLFGLACCTSILHLLTDVRSQEAVNVAEQFADGLVDVERLGTARNAAAEAADRFLLDHEDEFDADDSFQLPTHEDAQCHAAWAAHGTTCEPPWEAGWLPLRHAAMALLGPKCGLNDLVEDMMSSDPSEAVPLLRDIFGNPFHPTTIEPVLLTSTVVALAKSIYDEKAFDKMPILADALEEAGCTNQEVLQYVGGRGRM